MEERQSQEEEFVRLVHAHSGILHKVCKLYGFTTADRQDLFQEIVIQWWRSWPHYRGEAKISTWLYRIAFNTAISGLRRQKTALTRLDLASLPDTHDIPYTGEQEEQLQLLYTAIAHLTELEKALVMLYLEDRSYEEMEDILGINQNNLRVKMNRIKDKLRKLTKATDHGTGRS